MHSDIVGDGADDVLQEIYTSGVPDFSNIAYEVKQYETSSRAITTSKSKVFRFALTNEDGVIMNLNGRNWVFTLLIYCVASEHEQHASSRPEKQPASTAGETTED